MAAGKVFWACVAGVGYVYAGYPLALRVLARQAEASPASTLSPLPSVSLVIAAYDEEKAIGAKLDNSLTLDYPDLEIIVVTDGSQDSTPEIAHRYADRGVVVLHDEARSGKSAAINRGAAVAGGEILVFSDANNHFDTDAITHLVMAFADPQVGGATGMKTVLGDSDLARSEGLYWRYEDAIRRMESDLGSCTAANGEILAVRASAFQPIPADVVNDDAYLNMTLLGSGYRFVYVPEAISREKPADSLASEKERRSRMTAGRFALLARPGFLTSGGPKVTWQYLSHKAGRLAVPFLMAGALAASLVAFVGRRGGRGPLDLGGAWAWAALTGQAIVYGSAAVGTTKPDLVGGTLGSLCQAAGFLVAGNLATFGGFWRFVRGRQTVQWTRVGRED